MILCKEEKASDSPSMASSSSSSSSSSVFLQRLAELEANQALLQSEMSRLVSDIQDQSSSSSSSSSSPTTTTSPTLRSSSRSQSPSPSQGRRRSLSPQLFRRHFPSPPPLPSSISSSSSPPPSSSSVSTIESLTRPFQRFSLSGIRTRMSNSATEAMPSSTSTKMRSPEPVRRMTSSSPTESATPVTTMTSSSSPTEAKASIETMTSPSPAVTTMTSSSPTEAKAPTETVTSASPPMETKASMNAMLTSSPAESSPTGMMTSVSAEGNPVASSCKEEDDGDGDGDGDDDDDDDDDDKEHEHRRQNTELPDNLHLNILQSIGQAIYMFRLSGEITYWNRTAELLFGYSEEEAVGCDVKELLMVHRKEDDEPADILDRIRDGQSWAGKIPLKKKTGEMFIAMVTDSPFYDNDGKVLGVIEVSYDSQSFSVGSTSIDDGSESQQPKNLPLATVFTNLASKVSSKVSKLHWKWPENSVESEGGSGGSQSSDAGNIGINPEYQKPVVDPNSSGSSTPRSFFKSVPPSSILPFKPFHASDSQNEYEEEGVGKKPGVFKAFGSKTELWVAGLSHSLPVISLAKKRDDKDDSKGESEDENEGKKVGGLKAFSSWIAKKRKPWLQASPEDHEWINNENEHSIAEHDHGDMTNIVGQSEIEAPGSWNWAHVCTTNSNSSTGSAHSSSLQKNESELDSSDCEIAWEDLTLGEQIGQGSSGTVFHGLWFGSDVAIKVFTEQEYSPDLLADFRKEVYLMKRLRHPNIVLFMGAVTSSPSHLSIVTEFLPRGSLFRLLHRNTQGMDWKRRYRMALDIARGMNYLHHCNPPIIHRDLKSSNLLVDKNWTVKVADFGLSRMKHATFLTTKSGRGTPQWMAPEVLRNEPSDEKADVYSFGVILWELGVQQVPWDSLNAMQVVGAVGFMNQKLQVPDDLDPNWATLINDCWHSDPRHRPSFHEIMDRLKEMQRHLMERA